VSVDSIKLENGLKTNIIRLGQEIKIPGTLSKSFVQKVVNTAINDPLNVRKGPSVQYTVVTSLKTGTIVELLKEEGDWSYIKYGSAVGYVNAKYLKDYSAPTPAPVTNNPIVAPTASIVTTYTVQKGDTLFGIGKKFNVAYQDIVKWNQLSNNTIKVGQKLIVSNSQSSNAGSSIDTPSAPVTSYTVQKGDTLYSIGLKFNVSYQDIVKLNQLSNNTIEVGQKLNVPNSQASTVGGSVSVPEIQTPTVSSVMDPVYYTVKSGDTLSSVANKYSLRVDQVKAMNGLSSNIISSGQKLKVSYTQFIHPTFGRYSSYFGPRWGSSHDGIDIAQSGTVPVIASANGTVSRSYLSTSYGNVVFVVHSINGATYETVYAHLRNRNVQAGDKIQQGTLLGYMGNTGHSYGQHLHFEIHEGRWNINKTNAVDPLKYLK
jgi:murein DD-endopeptidase MepM/ murein hydrolase activator NlpD